MCRIAQMVCDLAESVSLEPIKKPVEDFFKLKHQSIVLSLAQGNVFIPMGGTFYRESILMCTGLAW